MNLVPGLEDFSAAAANAWDMLFGGGVGDLRRTPASIIHEAPQRTVYRYRPPTGSRPEGPPLLLVPPLAAPTTCFDLRRGCSLAEHMLAAGRPTYLVDYGPISFGDRALGLEHWIDDVIPGAIDSVLEDHGEGPVAIVGWCLGGIMSMLSVAAHRLQVGRIATVASPIDFERVRMMAPIRPLADLTGGRIVTTLYRIMGGAPTPLVRAGYQLAAIDKYLTKPLAVARNISNRDFLAQIDAVDDFTANMLAYPGRTFGQLYHRFFIVNELAEGRLELSGERTVNLRDIDIPVLSIAGETDTLAPVPAVHALGDVVPGVRLETAPGGHLGVLTGRAARNTTWAHIDAFLDAPRAAAARTAAAS